MNDHTEIVRYKTHTSVNGKEKYDSNYNAKPTTDIPTMHVHSSFEYGGTASPLVHGVRECHKALKTLSLIARTHRSRIPTQCGLARGELYGIPDIPGCEKRGR
jgi:hypothetical protein